MAPGDVSAQTRQVMKNLEAVLAAGGASFADVVRTTIFLTDLGSFQAVNAVYAEFFPTAPPARATVQVSALPRGASVEIDAVAFVGDRLPASVPPMPKNTASSNQFSPQVLDVDAAGASQAVRSVGADEQADLVDAWVARTNVGAVAAVARDDEAPSPARKAARRALNVLKSRGVKIPDATTVSRPLSGKGESTDEARLAAPDANGTMLLTFLRRTPGKDARIVEVILLDGVGIQRASGGYIAGSKLREWEQSTKQRTGFAPVPVPIDWARSRVAAARADNAKSGALLPLELEACADLLDPIPATAPEHPVLALGLAVEGDDATARVAASGSLHNEPELNPYMAPAPAMQEMLVKVGEKLGSPDREIDPEELRKLLAEEMSSATDRLFTPERREALARRLLDAGISIHARLGVERTKDLLATRKAILDAGLITSPPREIPFLRAFFEKSLAVLSQQWGGQIRIPVAAPSPAPPEGGLVLTPQQLAAIEAAKSGETVTEGGIVLP